LLAAAFCALAQDGTDLSSSAVTSKSPAPAESPEAVLSNTGQPMKVNFTCGEEDLAAAGMSCSDEDPCPIYLELSSVSAAGKKLSLAGNLHGPSTTLYSILLASDDGGATWQEPAGRIQGAALDQVQMFDALHGWAAGEEQVPLARDPFFLVTDNGRGWRRKPLTEEGGPGAVQRFWFDSADHGQLIIDAGRTAQGGRYALYETHTAGDSWNILSKTVQIPRIARAPSVENVDYRIGADNRTHSFNVEKREGENWTRLSSFLVQVASCGSPHAEPAHEPEAAAPPEPPIDAK
jgi:hypothetical protein